MKAKIAQFCRDKIQPRLDALKAKAAQLKQRAAADYNRLWLERGCYEKFATAKSDEGFIRRICVNFIRHELSEYESQLDQAHGRINAETARTNIRRRILDAIAKAYPWLSDECRRQKKGEQRD